MNKTVLSIVVPTRKRRAIELFGADSPYRPRIVPNKKAYDRNKTKRRHRDSDNH